MASPELQAFLEKVDPEYKDYAELLHNASFRKVKEIAAATAELLKAETKGLVPIGPAGAIVAAAKKAADPADPAVAAAGGGHQGDLVERLVGPLKEQLEVTKELAKETKEMAKETKELAKQAYVTNLLLRNQAAAQFKYTTSQATQHREPGFKEALIEAYGCGAPEGPEFHGKLFCMASGQFVSRQLVCAAHLFKHAWFPHVSQVMGFDNINDPANGLLFIKPIEEAFDNGYMCITWKGTRGAERSEGEYQMRWLGDAALLIQDMKNYPWKASPEKLTSDAQDDLRALKNEAGGRLRFMDLNGKPLSFKTDARPYRRCLIFQARFAFKQALAMGRITQQQLAEMGPYLRPMSREGSNMEMFWQAMPDEGPEAPPEPTPVEDTTYDFAPQCPSDED